MCSVEEKISTSVPLYAITNYLSNSNAIFLTYVFIPQLWINLESMPAPNKILLILKRLSSWKIFKQKDTDQL